MNPRPFIYLSIVCFIASLFFSVFNFDDNEPVLGYHVLLWGWWGFVMFNAGWFGNISWIFSKVKFIRGNYKSSFRWSIATFILSLEGFLATEWWFTEATGTRVVGLGAGFWLWFVALMVPLVLNILIKRSTTTASPLPPL